MNYFYLAAGARPTNVAQLSGDKDGKTEIDFHIGKDSTPEPARKLLVIRAKLMTSSQ